MAAQSDSPPAIAEATGDNVPLPAEHRRLLVSEARAYALMGLFPTFPLLLFLAFALSPASKGHQLVIWPLIVVCGVARTGPQKYLGKAPHFRFQKLSVVLTAL